MAPARTNPKSFRPTAEDAALIAELMQFYGVSSESELLRMAYRALNRERHALEEMYPRLAQPTGEKAQPTGEKAPAPPPGGQAAEDVKPVRAGNRPR